jgi:hypothetical protein
MLMILVCTLWCLDDDVTRIARSANWSAPAAIAGIPTHDGDRQEWEAPWERELSESRFETQRACLHGLRRLMPEEDEMGEYPGGGWEQSTVRHHRDYVSSFGAVGRVEGSANMVRTYYYACFQESPRIW